MRAGAPINQRAVGSASSAPNTFANRNLKKIRQGDGVLESNGLVEASWPPPGISSRPLKYADFRPHLRSQGVERLNNTASL